MDWKEIATTVAKAAPLLGGALGGPVGAVAGAAGSLLASFLGVEPDPASVAQALGNPDLVIKLKELEVRQQDKLLEWQGIQLKAELAAETAGIASVNRTMRAEGVTEHWPQYSWRPAWGFASALAFLIVSGLCCLLAWEAVKGKDVSALNMIPQLVTSMATLFAIPGAILGVSAWHRGMEKRQASCSGEVSK